MRWSPTTLLALVALVVGGLVVADLGASSSASDRPDPVAAGPAVGGAWYCAAGAVSETDELSVITATPTSATNPADTEVRALHGRSTVVATIPVFPGSARLTGLGVEGVDGASVGAAVRWWDEPTVASRVWRIQGQGPSGLVSGPCASRPSPTWYIPGLSTAGGGTAQLYLANPFATDASVEISFTTPSGPEAPILLENVSVSSASVTVVDLSEYIPRQADIGVRVQTRSGRVVVEGVQRLDAAIGGVDAVALVRAAPQLSETWTIPWAMTDPVAGDAGVAAAQDATVTEAPPTTEAPADTGTPAPTESPAATEAPTGDGDATEEPEDTSGVPGGAVVRSESPGDGTASWLWVSNPGDQAAAVTVMLHTATGAEVPDIGEELLIEAGQVLRVDLRGLLPPGQSTTGATVRSENGVPVVAGSATLFAPEAGDADASGYATELGWPGGDASWVVPGEGVGRRQQVVHVVNPGADPAVVDVAVWDGAALRRPTELQEVTVEAGALVELDITEVVSGADQMVAFVTAREGVVVAGRHSVGPEVADWIAHTGVPSGLWSGGDVVPPVDHDPQLIERLGTSGGLPATDPDAVAPTPTPGPATPPGTPMPGEPPGPTVTPTVTPTATPTS